MAIGGSGIVGSGKTKKRGSPTINEIVYFVRQGHGQRERRALPVRRARLVVVGGVLDDPNAFAVAILHPEKILPELQFPERTLPIGNTREEG